MREPAGMLSAWNSFYVMIGSSSAALTGLVFVVITLMRESDNGANEDGVSTFSTPTVVHFCCALFTSALMCAPFESLLPIAVILGLAGIGGMAYVVRIAHLASLFELYKPDAEDWVWNALLPFIAYATLVLGAVTIALAPGPGLFAPAAAVLMLIFIGIHNAWDVVTFLATGKAEALRNAPARSDPQPPDQKGG